MNWFRRSSALCIPSRERPASWALPVCKRWRTRGESLLGALRDGKITVTSELITGLLALLDGLRAILRLIETSGTEGHRSTDDDRELIALLSCLNSGGRATVERAEPLPQDHPELWAASAAQEQTLRIDVDVLNRMMNLVGELVLTRNQIAQWVAASPHSSELVRRLNIVTTELRESVRQARMQPVGHVFGKFPRLVRDLPSPAGGRYASSLKGRRRGWTKACWRRSVARLRTRFAIP